MRLGAQYEVVEFSASLMFADTNRGMIVTSPGLFPRTLGHTITGFASIRFSKLYGSPTRLALYLLALARSF